MAKRDVQLVVRAKDEATKAFDSVASALQSLLGVNDKVGTSAGKTGDRLEELARVALTIDRAVTAAAGASDKAAASFAAQQARIAAAAGEYDHLRRQADSMAKGLAILQREADKAFIGPRRDGLSAALRGTKADLASLEQQIKGLGGSLSGDLANLGKARSSLQQIGSTEIAMAEAATTATTAIRQQTAAIREQSAAAAVMGRVNTNTGVTRDRGDMDALIGQLHAESAAHDTLIAKLRSEEAAEAELARTKAARARAGNLLPVGRTFSDNSTLSGKSARDSASVFQEADIAAGKKFEAALRGTAAAAKEEAAALAKLRADLNPLAVIEAELATETEKLVRWQKAGKITTTELAQATALLKGNADRAAQSLGRTGIDSRGRPSMFGLKPYELQNLGFQINDVVTQLASGTSLSQTLAQQGGQIIQLFPKVGSAIVGAFKSGPILGAVAAVGLFVIGMKEALTQAEQMRAFQGTLSANADGALFNATALARNSEELKRFGLSAEDALAAVRTFVREGVNPTRILEFGVAAKNLADILGIDVKDATKQVSEAFTGGYAAVKKLDDATNFLTAGQREHIRVLFEQGKAAQASSEAFRLFSERMSKGAEDARGPWSDAMRSLDNAWNTFLKTVGNTKPIQDTFGLLQTLAKEAEHASNWLAGIRTRGDIALNIGAKQSDINFFDNIVKEGQRKGQDITSSLAELVRLRAEMVKLQAELTAFDAKAKASATEKTRVDKSNAQLKIDDNLRKADEKDLATDKESSKEKRIQTAYQAALLEAQQIGASEKASADHAELAARRELRKINAEITAENEKQLAAQEATIKSFSAKAVGVESGGNSNAKNPLSTATGLGQFIESTWLDLFRRHFPAAAAGMGDSAILALRRDAETSKKMIEVYARENADVLKKAGQSVTEANLYLTHFLGAAGAKKVLAASRDTAISSLLKPDQINANPSILGGKATAGSVRDFASRKFDDASSADGAITQRLVALENERLDKQAEFNAKVDDENEKRRLGIASMEQQQGLQGEALILEEKKRAVADALLAKQQEIDKINADLRDKGLAAIEYTDAQKKAVEETTSAYFDLAHARDIAQARRDTVDKPVADLTAVRDELRQQIEFLHEIGNSSLIDQVQPQLDAVNARLVEAIANAREFYASLTPGTAGFPGTQDELDAIKLKLDDAKEHARDFGYTLGIANQVIAQNFAGTMSNALDSFAKNIAAGKSAIRSLRDAFLSFASDFLRQIAQMIEQQLLFKFVLGLIGSVAGPATGGAGGSANGLGAVGGLQAHGGGIIGGAGPTFRLMSPGWFDNATARFHGGGIAGLKPDEVPAILKRGEEVLTEADARHRNNGGMGASPVIKLKNVTVFDAAEVLSKSLATEVGEKVFLNFIRANAGAVRSVLG